MKMASIHNLTPCLWFDGNAEEAANFYTAIFPNSRIVSTQRFGEAGKEIHGQEPGTVMTVSFELDGQPFTGLNGGPLFQFSEAISFVIHCDTQEEVDHFWEKLGEGGPVEAQQCGWVKDKFGVSWQVVPRALFEMLEDPDTAKRERTLAAMLQMKKLHIAGLRAAYEG